MLIYLSFVSVASILSDRCYGLQVTGGLFVFRVAGGGGVIVWVSGWIGLSFRLLLVFVWVSVLNQSEFQCWIGVSFGVKSVEFGVDSVWVSVLNRFEFGVESVWILVLNRWVACRFGCGFFLDLVSGGGGEQWRAFFWDLLLWWMVMVSIFLWWWVQWWWVAVPIWVLYIIFLGLWVWKCDRWCGVCGCGLAVRLMDDRGLGGWWVAVGEEVLGRIERWERREKNRFVYII